MKAYMIDTKKKVYLSFGNDCMEAAVKVVKLTGCNLDDISIGSTFTMADDPEPICISRLWPYFTPYPGRHAQD